MGPSQITFFFLLFAFLSNTLSAAFPADVSSSILHALYQGDSERGFKLYLDYAKKSQEQDYELLQEAAGRLLEYGMKNGEREEQLLCIFGAGVSTNSTLIPILESGLKNKEPKIQLTALHYLSRLNDDEAENAIQDCLSSPNLLLRLESSLVLAEKNDPEIVEQMESLYFKVPIPIRPLFAEIISPVRTMSSSKFLEKLMCDESRDVRLHTIIEAGRKKRDDLLPRLQKIATLTDPATQEAALNALLQLQDSASKPLFEQMVKKKNPFLKLVAMNALYRLGDESILNAIESMALEKNLFAFNLYCELAPAELAKELLAKFLDSPEFTLRLNASLGLLKRGDARGLNLLKALLLQKEKVFVTEIFSSGRALSYWSETHEEDKSRLDTEMLREKILIHALELPEEEFLSLAKEIFDGHVTELIPILIELLINHDSEKTIALLKQMQQKTGAPFIRNYCNLALYKLKVPGPYEANLLAFIQDGKNHPLIRFRDKKEKNESPTHSSFSLNPEERSQLLITSFETLAQEQNQQAIMALIHAIAYGHPQNRYALAGLLIRSAE